MTLNIILSVVVSWPKSNASPSTSPKVGGSDTALEFYLNIMKLSKVGQKPLPKHGVVRDLNINLILVMDFGY